jgi:copper chaperone CopZ
MEKIITANEVREKIFKSREGALVEMLDCIEDFSKLENLSAIECKRMLRTSLSEKIFSEHDGFGAEELKIINAKLEECGVYLVKNEVNREIYLELTESKKDEFRKIINREINEAIIKLNGVMNSVTSFDDAAAQLKFNTKCALNKAFTVFKQAGYKVSIECDLWLDVHVELH